MCCTYVSERILLLESLNIIRLDDFSTNFPFILINVHSGKTYITYRSTDGLDPIIILIHTLKTLLSRIDPAVPGALTHFRVSVILNLCQNVPEEDKDRI